MNRRVPPPKPAPRITGVKFSQIAPAGVTPPSGTQFLAVTGGTTDNLYTIDQIAGFGGIGQMTWVPYTTFGQTFLPQNLTRDGDWTMVAKTTTTDRPAPQPSGAEEDLLPSWLPNRQSAVGALVIYNEWTVNVGGWIDQYGVDIIRQNVGDTHAITLSVNGSIRDTFTAIASNEGIYWHNIAPIVVASGAVIRVTLQISATGTNSWYQQVGLFGTAPVYCSLAVGSLNGAAGGTTAYNCHLLFTPGTVSPNWDIVAYGGEAAGGLGGGVGGIAGGPYRVANLPTGTIGQMVYVIDGVAGQSWAATIVGGGTSRYLVWFNGANWTVVGNGGYSAAMFVPTYYIYGF
jgi:hypothetical protein